MVKEEIQVPRRADMTQLNKIIMGYLSAGADTEPVNFNEVAERTGIARTTVSLNNSFLVSSGFLTQEKRGYFRLTENGAKYAQFISWGRLEDAREPLQAIVNGYPLFKKINDYVRINPDVTREDLVSRVAAITGVPKKAGYVRGMNAVVDLLLFSGLLKEEDERISSLERKVVKPIERVSAVPEVERKTFGTEIAFPINVTINVSEDTSKDKFKELMEVIREVFSQKRDEE